MKRGLFTSESVSAGHPDKVADQLSDAVLDAMLAQDPASFVACETLVKTGMVLLAGEVTTSAWVDLEHLVRDVLRGIGYTYPEGGFDADSCAVISAIGKQSADIACGVERGDGAALGAGDQGLMFGYACRETDVLMPAPIVYANRLVERQATLRRDGTLPWLRPDAKSQVTFRYENGQPVGVDNVVFSTQHAPDVDLSELKDAVMSLIIEPTFPAAWLGPDTLFYINPTGRFVIGGPVGDCGLTGRKIIVDTYGGMARHGGGAFSGKDPTKVDRSAAYMARYVAKNVVAAGLADRCELQLTYAIGVPHPTSLAIETFGTSTYTDQALIQAIEATFDLTPAGILSTLDLRRPIYQATAAYGHFGREVPTFTWERTDRCEALRDAVVSA